MGPGPLIAIDVTLLYLFFGPLVLFGIYVFFDSLDRSDNPDKGSETKTKEDPALWTEDDVRSFMDQR